MDNNEQISQINTSIENSVQQSPAPEEPKPKKQNVIWIIIAAILVIAGIITCVVLLNRPKEDSVPEPGPVVDGSKKQDDKNISFRVRDDSIPGGLYDIDINFSEKKLKVKKTRFCSAVDCDSITSEQEITMTDEEAAKIKKIIAKINIEDEDKDKQNKLYFATALSEIVAGDSVISTREESDYYDSLYGGEDLNKDGILTYRESGNSYLDIIIIELRIN